MDRPLAAGPFHRESQFLSIGRPGRCKGILEQQFDGWLRAEEEILRAREEAIDEASEESYPASDPPVR
jgi:hypothetical protein